MSTEAARAAGTYARRIRNEAKRRYALKCIAAVMAGQPMPASPANLGTMGAQAVRLSLAEIFKN